MRKEEARKVLEECRGEYGEEYEIRMGSGEKPGEWYLYMFSRIPEPKKKIPTIYKGMRVKEQKKYIGKIS